MSSHVKRVARGAGWLFAYRWGERLLDLLSILVLARLLTPEDFGLVAIAASVVAIIEGLSELDVDKALIHHRDEHRSLYDTAWTLSALRGLLSALWMLLIASFLDDRRTAEVVAVLALSPVLKGFSNPRFVTFERDLIYSRLAGLTLGSKIVSVGATLFVAILYRSYWALVIGILIGAAIRLLLTYLLKPYRPRPSLARFSDLFAFSGWMSLTTIVTTLAMETDKIIIGRLLGVADAGLYFMTQKIGVLPTRELISPLQRILFPSFREISGDAPRLRRVVLESVNVLGSLSLPAGFGFALVAADLVPLALGVQWLPIVPLLTLLVPFLGLRGTLSMVLPCVLALGRTRLLFQVSTVYALVHVPLFVAGTAWLGLKGSILGIVVAGVFYTYLNAWLLRHTLGITFREIFTALRRPLAATLVMTSTLFSLDLFGLFATSPEGSWLGLTVRVLLGACAFVGTQLTLWRLQGCPAGIEQRVLQVLRPSPPSAD